MYGMNAWRMEITTCTGNFFLQNNIFKIDQLIAENLKSSKQTFDLFHVIITSIGYTNQLKIPFISDNSNILWNSQSLGINSRYRQP